MQDILLLLSGIITIGSVVPYIKDILKGRTKPNIVSWLTWTLLTLVATIAEISAGEYRTAFFTGAAVVETSLIVMLGIKFGYVKYTKLDIACQLGAIVGFLFWWIFNSPTIAVVAAVSIDFIGAIPTLYHSWQKPNEETWQTFALAGSGGLLALFAINSYNAISLSYPIYIVIVNIAMTSVIILRSKRQAV